MPAARRIYLGTDGGDGMAKRQIAAALAAVLATGALYICTLPQPEAKSVAAERITQTVTMQALSGTALQMDVCETPLIARISAARLTDRGSAGYVLAGERYRVLAIMLDTEAEALQMQQKLAQSGVQTELCPCSGQELTMKVTADAGQIRALTKAVHAVDMAAVQPGRIAMQLDAGEIDAEYARGLMAMLVSDLETAQQNFAEAEPSGLPAEALNGLMRRAVAALQPLTADSVPAAQLTGRMRCAGLSVWFAREDWIQSMKNT